MKVLIILAILWPKIITVNTLQSFVLGVHFRFFSLGVLVVLELVVLYNHFTACSNIALIVVLVEDTLVQHMLPSRYGGTLPNSW